MVESTSEIKPPSKKAIERDSKKLKNKTQRAITVLCKSEDEPVEKLIAALGEKGVGATGRLFVTHFGNGDEAD
jgi:hypothetical protein